MFIKIPRLDNKLILSISIHKLLKGNNMLKYKIMFIGLLGTMLSVSSYSMTEEEKMYANQLNAQQKYYELFQFSKPFAEQGDMHSQFLIGNLYELGDGVRKDYTKAAIWYSRAANQGYPKAQRALAWLYQDGRGVKKDINKTLFLLEKAAEGGDSSACNGLAAMYLDGEVVRKDFNKAKEYYGRSCDLGDDWGCKQYAKMAY